MFIFLHSRILLNHLRKRLFLFSSIILFLATLPVTLQAQTVIRGSVADNSGNPIAGVSVYLSGTYDGASTAADGTYRFSTDLTGSHTLTFSFIGYERKLISLELVPGSTTLTHDAKLREVPMELGEVEVVSSNTEWKRNYERFVEQFIGTGSFADETEILNPYQIDFENADEPGYMVASAPEPIEVVNNALGYRLHIELDEYKWLKSGSTGYYTIYARFEEMEPSNNREGRHWRQNREKAYNGSATHFFRSLYNDRLRTNGFDYRESYNLEPLNNQETKFNLIGQIGVSEKMLEVVKGFRLVHGIRVEYGRIDQTGRGGSSAIRVQTSDLLPTRQDRTFYIDEMGNLLNPRSIEIQGDMATQRVAHLLPLNYEN